MLTFNIITPTIQRQSLVECCRSLETQTYPNWQHVVAVDSDQFDSELMAKIQHPHRDIFLCGQKYGHYGNHARWMAWEKCTCDYLIGLDCDNAMYRNDALADIAAALESDNYPDFALFPIHRHGSIFLMLPPGLCRTDTANVVVKCEIGRWPDIEAREADGHWVEALASKYRFTAFPDMQPIILMEKSSNGI